MWYELYGVAFSAASRVLAGEVELSQDAREHVDRLRDGLDDATNLVGDLELQKPVSWARFGARLMDRAFGFETEETISQRLSREQCNHYDWKLPSLWTETFLRAKPEVVLEDDEHQLWKVSLPNGTRYFVQLEQNALNGPAFERRENSFNPRLPDDADERERVYEGVAELFWSERRAVMLDSSLRGESFCTLSLDGPAYHGPLELLIERWKAYQAADVRRSVLIQGRPGSGKSTFALHSARALSDRTLVLTAESCDSLGDGPWYTLLRVLDPTMIIMDDIDRLSEHRLERKLRMFEEGYCDVPILLFTSNDYERLPLPLRRPGRIDQILEVEEPDEAIVRDVIRRIAERELVEVPCEQMDLLLEISRRLSMAHVVERLRRARVEGWHASDVDGDITFSRGYLLAGVAPEDEDEDDDDLAAAE